MGETDPATGQIVANIGSLPISSGLADIDFAPDGFVYGVASRTLYRINPATAATEIVGVYNWDLRGIASEPSLAPAIQVSLSAGGISISWPPASQYVLRYATELPSAAWTPISTPPTRDGNQMVVTIPITNNSRFFQLQGP